ncbi:alkaline phosphatase D family protein [Bacillus sp. NTK034]|uniref:alkaline phosphatase D family protein n=1 Tax=Bacillus sp. NTK034 TaxID=2802176 RepID=UPI001A8ECD2F|nr:alkaline phosphatase D family protein [Bacillus sp. NTK034]MBN8203279.1 alkaline phosphatase D family protein [Bacillus sp. NTK034]
MNNQKWLKDITAKKMTRRNFLEVTGKTAAVAAFFSLPVITSVNAEETPDFSAYPFTLGVASGDPLSDSVVLWTRLAPNPLAEDGNGGMDKRYVSVEWEVAEDEAFKKIVRRGKEITGPELGHSVHAEVFGLRPWREYYYRFKAGNEISPVGRTKTAPGEGSHLKSLSFAIASCQAWAGGRFAAYKNMAEEDLDVVFHLGDYIYEKGDTETLADYRLLHAQYKTSPDLQAAHSAFPFIVTFDDHEVDNDWSNDISDPNYPEGERERFLAVRAAAFQAYYEHMPLRRRSKPNGPDMLLYRKFTYGDLAEFSVLDTRQYRDNQVGKGFPGGPLDPEASNPERTMVGSEQGLWLIGNLHRSQAKWNVLAQQTMMAQYDYDPGEGISVNHDQWDGYSADRDRLFEFIKKRRPSNPIVLGGDWHSSWVNDLKEDFNDPKSKTLATEFVGTSISSGCGWKDQVEAALSVNPHVKFFDGEYRGYVRFHVTHKSWQSDYRVVSSPSNPEAAASTIASFEVKNGKAGAMRIGGVDVTDIQANTMIAGKPSPVTVSLSNGTKKAAKVHVSIPVPKGWKSESVTAVIEAQSSLTVEVMATPPAAVPAAERLRVEVDAGKTTVFGRPRDVQAVSVPAGDEFLLALDAGVSTSPVFTSFKRFVPEDTWDNAKGYGWIGTSHSARDRNKLDELQRDMIVGRDAPATLRLAIPAGIHRIYFLTGDAIYTSANTIIHSDNKMLAETGGTLAPGQFKWLHFDLDGGSSGKEIDLSITGELGDGWWRLVSLMMK